MHDFYDKSVNCSTIGACLESRTNMHVLEELNGTKKDDIVVGQQIPTTNAHLEISTTPMPFET